MPYSKARQKRRYINGQPYGLTEDYYLWSNSSPRDASGKLVLVSNEHTMINSRLVADQQCPKDGPQFTLQGAELRPAFGATQSQRNEVRAKFIGRLRYGDASLGVTAASWRQSREMITSRSQKLFRFFTEVGRKKKRHLSQFSRKDWTKTRASDVLEGQFGWVPLLEDIHKTMGQTFAHSIPPHFASSSAKHAFQEVNLSKDRNFGTDSFKNGHVRITYGAKVEVSNPNLWIANRLGLIDLPSIAWDLVPWSFVVNMFVNTGDLIGSLTDTVGLTITDGSLTTTSHASLQVTQFAEWDQNLGYDPEIPGFRFAKRRNTAMVSVLCKQRTRVYSGVPTPSLEFRMPDVDLGLAVIGFALVTQKVGGLIPNGQKFF